MGGQTWKINTQPERGKMKKERLHNRRMHHVHINEHFTFIESRLHSVSLLNFKNVFRLSFSAKNWTDKSQVKIFLPAVKFLINTCLWWLICYWESNYTPKLYKWIFPLELNQVEKLREKRNSRVRRVWSKTRSPRRYWNLYNTIACLKLLPKKIMNRLLVKT